MTPERVKTIYASLEKLVIELDSDPSSRGYKYLQDLISKTRGFLNETSHYLSEVLRERQTLEMDLQAEESAFEVRSDELLASDARVSRLPNIDDRKAMINLILSDEKKRIQELKRQIKNLGFVEKVVRHRHKELENSMSAIRLQRSLVETEARTGSFYGDESETSRGTRGGGPPLQEFDDAEIQSLFSSAKEELSAASPQDDEEAPPAVSAPVAAQDLPITPDEFEDLLLNIDGTDEVAPAQPVVEAKKADHKPDPNEDPDVAKFLDGDDLEGIFDGI